MRATPSFRLHLLSALLGAVTWGSSPATHALGLMQAYEAALVHDPAYRAALSEKDAGQQYQFIGRAHVLPTISASRSVSTNKTDVTTSGIFGDQTEERRYTSQATSIQLRQPLYHPEGKARQRQGLLQTQASETQFALRGQELIARVLGLYVQALYVQDQIALAQAQLNTLTEQRLANERMLQAGEGTKTDVIETLAKYDAAQAQLLEAQYNLVNERNALSAIVGEEVGVLEPLVEDFKIQPLLPEGFEAWREMALQRNPEIALQRFAVQIASEEVQKNHAGHHPRVDLLANISKSSSDTVNTFNQGSIARSIGLQLNMPLYAGGAVVAATSQAVSNHQKALAELDAKTGQVLLELRKQYSLAYSSILRITAANKSLSSAALLVEATQKSVKGGHRTNLDVLNAQQQWFDAKRELALSRYNYLLSLMRLRSSAGTLASTDLQKLAGYFVPAR